MPATRSAAVVFIHGLARKPSPDKLREIWLWALGRDNPMPSIFAAPNNGLNLGTRGIPQRLTYYADIFYGTDFESDETLEIQAEGLDSIEPDLQLPAPVTPRERQFLVGFEAKLSAAAALSPATEVAAAGGQATDAGAQEIARWLPDPVKRTVIRKAAMEAYYFLFDKEYVRPDGARFFVRREMRSRLLRDLQAARPSAERLVIVSHSMGTMLAYDVLRNCPECPKVDTLITLGSPLGIREVQDELSASPSGVDFPPASLDAWVNVYDPLDPICGPDPRIANDYHPSGGRKVVDVLESNWGRWRHTITHYLAGTELRRHLGRALGIG
ncbi:MAG: hypothetical protein AB7F99_16365 [Vicinamibacterales bacterium]